MNEEELKEEEMWTCPICKEENFFDYPCKNGCEKKINKKRLEEYQVGFQKGKLEQKKEELDYWTISNFEEYSKGELIFFLRERIKQLQKEIGGMRE